MLRPTESPVVFVQQLGRGLRRAENKDDKISKEFYYLGRILATGETQQFIMPNTTKTAVEIHYRLETPMREDIYEYIVS